jgi:sensor c-di-GMP phosphodiesterase-like protein
LGAEALIRWESDKYCSVLPEVFIPLMEDTGLIVRATEWLLKETFAQ